MPRQPALQQQPRPYDDATLGQRIRVIWEGSEYRRRGRQTIWDGGVALTGNRFERIAPINLWNLDKELTQTLARSLRQLIETVEDLEKRGIGFESLTEQVDTTAAAGRLTFHIFACMAEFERSIGRQRTRAALEASRARGRKGGRPPALSAKDLAHAKALLYQSPDVWATGAPARAIGSRQGSWGGIVGALGLPLT
jgi:Resolvase, N terminal domain